MISYHELLISHLWREGQLGYLRQKVELEGFQEQNFQVPGLKSFSKQLCQRQLTTLIPSKSDLYGHLQLENPEVEALKICQPWHIYTKFIVQADHRDFREQVPTWTRQPKHPCLSLRPGRGCFPSRTALAKDMRWPPGAPGRAGQEDSHTRAQYLALTAKSTGTLLGRQIQELHCNSFILDTCQCQEQSINTRGGDSPKRTFAVIATHNPCFNGIPTSTQEKGVLQETRHVPAVTRQSPGHEALSSSST